MFRRTSDETAREYSYLRGVSRRALMPFHLPLALAPLGVGRQSMLPVRRWVLSRMSSADHPTLGDFGE